MADQVARNSRPRRATTLAILALTLAAGTAKAAQTAVACADAGAGYDGTPRLTVTALGAHSARGNITFTLYGDQRSKFLAHHGSIALTRTMLSGTAADGCFAVSAPGTYAIAIYHDENNNHRFDRTLLGLPAEGYGFSNDAPTALGLPTFNTVRFTLTATGAHITVHLRY